MNCNDNKVIDKVNDNTLIEHQMRPLSSTGFKSVELAGLGGVSVKLYGTKIYSRLNE